jgi:hypothetical protein
MTTSFSSPRMRREARTVEAMVRRYCRDHHQPHPLCGECADLLAYALKRLQHCPFQGNKTTCGKCPVHCYTPRQQERIREVMRYAGPKMLLTHPILALLHLLDGLRRPR